MVERRYLPALAVVALALLLLGLLAVWVPGVVWGIGLLGSAFLVRLRLDPPATTWTPIAAGWLLLVAELAYLSYELEGTTWLRPASGLPRLLQVALLALAAAAACELATVGASILPAAGPWSLAAGAVALALLLGILFWLAHRVEAGRSAAKS